MAKQSKALQYADPTFNLANNYAELAEQVKVMAKFADRRLREIEVAKHDPYFRGIEKFAYRKALYEIQHFKGAKEDAKRFDTKLPSGTKGSYQQLVKRANALREFINAPTSTRRGTISVYDKRAQKLNKHYGTDFDWRTLANFFENGGKNLLETYGSDVVMLTIAQVTNNEDKNIRKIKDYNERIKTAEMDKELKSVAKSMTDNGFDWSILE